MDNVDTMQIETLSYLSVALRNRFHTEKYRLVWRLGLVPAVPRLQHHLLNCQSMEELRQIVICFHNLAFLISDRMMDQLMTVVMKFINQGELKKVENFNILNKLLALSLAKKDWHDDHGDYMATLLNQFKGNCKHLRPVNAVTLCKVVKSQMEPTSVLYEVYDRLVEILKNRGFVGHTPMITVLSSMLSINPSAVPIKEIEQVLEEIIDSPDLGYHVDDVLNIVRNVGIVNSNLVDNFFNLALDLLNEDSTSDVVKFASRYISMYSTYTGMYRNKEFEAKVVKLILEDIELQDVLTYHPQAFAARLSLLIEFGVNLDDNIINKFKDFLNQYNAKSLLSISRAIDFRLKREEMKLMEKTINRNHRSPELIKIEEMNVLVNKASEEKFLKVTLEDKLVEIADLIKNYIYRNDFFNESFMNVKELLIERIDRRQGTTRAVSTLCSSVANPRQKIEAPDLLDSFVRFYLGRPDPTELHTHSVFRLLEVCFDSGHDPDIKFTNLCCDLLRRDIDAVSGRTAISMALMLCYYRSISKSLVTAIFSNEFMSRLDNELQMAVDRRHYPKMLRRSLMELNRAVVLRYPEFGVPWFHSKYCAEHEISLRLKLFSDTIVFKDQVSQQLEKMFGGWRYYKENSFSQYYNFIDFEVHFDGESPVDLSAKMTHDPDHVTRVAIQVLPSHMITVDTRAVGKYMLCNREELELQGWKVVTVNPYTWNSLQLGSDTRRKDYLWKEIKSALRQDYPIREHS